MRYFVGRQVPPAQGDALVWTVYNDLDQVIAACVDQATAVVVAHALQTFDNQGLTVSDAYRQIVELRGGVREQE